jgi:DNA mismatch repair protein MSH6
LDKILLESGDNGASDVLLSLINAYQSICRGPLVIEKVPSSTTFPKSTALCADIRRKLQRNGEEVKPWDNKETLDELHRKAYFPRASRLNQESKGTERWPKVLHAVIEGGADLALSSFGAVLFHLQRNLIDQEILRMGTVKAYIPPKAPEALDLPLLESLVDGDDLDTAPSTALASPSPQNRQIAAEQVDSMGPEEEVNHMSLDGTTLHNLEILTNTSTFTSSGSLWSRVNYTKTPHGSRLLRAWLLRPLFRKADIDRRADAVEELLSENVNAALGEARQVLAKCGDIDRLLSRVHSMSGFEPQAEFGGCHPNERAVLYESATHTKRKVGDFSKLLNGLRQTTRIPEIFGGLSISSGLLRKLVCSTSNGGCFPEMEHQLDWFFQNFDCDLASKGLFEPSRGVDQEYDDACDAIERIRTELECYKEEICSQVLRGSSRTHWKYINIKDDSKDKYLIELPASIRVPEDFLVKGKRGSGSKQVNKYRTGVVESLVQELESALDIHKEGKARGMQLIFAKFASMRKLWAAAAQTTSMLDALGSLAEASSRPGFTRPTILACPPNTKPCIHIIKGQHPCVEITHNGGQFIPNDLTLGEYTCNGSNRRNGERVLLLSGPNMGGKSTLLRQTCLISILAQIGCYVPAEECALTPIDRIFTRLGACDRILLGQSTFFVELAEMATALRGATRRSLVIMDELGRGTSTFDGTAIASACVKHLVENNQCLTLFATHYHTLLTEWQHQPIVRLGHMECYVENEDNSSNKEKSEKEQNITFLYTLGSGPCPQSFGVNVAKLAGLPNEVLLRARQKSLKFEKELTSFSDKIDSLQADDLCEKLATAIQNEDANAVTDIAEYLENISPTNLRM